MESENFNILPNLPENMQGPEIKIIKTNKHPVPKVAANEESIFEKYKTLIYGLIIVILIVVIGVMIYLYIANKKEDTPKQKQKTKQNIEYDSDDEPEAKVAKPKIKSSTLQHLLKRKNKPEILKEETKVPEKPDPTILEGQRQLAEHIKNQEQEQEEQQEEEQEEQQEEEQGEQEEMTDVALNEHAQQMSYDELPPIKEVKLTDIVEESPEDDDDTQLLLRQQRLSKPSANRTKMLSKDNFIIIKDTNEDDNGDKTDLDDLDYGT